MKAVKNKNVKNIRFDKSALTQHSFDLNHRMDWDNSKVFDFESNYYTRRLIESFHINSDKDTMNEERPVLPPNIYSVHYNFLNFLRAVHPLIHHSVVFTVLSFNQRSPPPEFLSARCHLEAGAHTFYNIRARISRQFVFSPDEDSVPILKRWQVFNVFLCYCRQ